MGYEIVGNINIRMALNLCDPRKAHLVQQQEFAKKVPT